MTKSMYYDTIKKKYSISDNQSNIFIIGTPDHGNLGDQAIAYAELQLLRTYFSNEHIVEVNMHDFVTDIDAIFHLIKLSDIIFLQGGGNFGNIYLDDEMMRRYIVSRFVGIKIILFPQSVYFTDDESGVREREISSKIYSKNKNLYLIARDVESEKILKKYFANSVYKLPDVVLTLAPKKANENRKGVLLCFRNDREGILKFEQQKKIENYFNAVYGLVERIDTVVQYKREKFERFIEVDNILNKIGSAELVVTDRLHGLIFSVLTGTPCIALPTFNKKITSAYEEIKGLGNVYFLDNLDGLDNLERSYSNFRIYKNDTILQNYKKVLNEIICRQIVCSNADNQGDIIEAFEMAGYWSTQIFETSYWKTVIDNEYKKLVDSNNERISELATYKEWTAHLEDEKAHLEDEKKHYQSDYQSALNNIALKEREMVNYRNWVENLQKQQEQLQEDYDNTVNNLELTKKEVDEYKDWVKDLQHQIEILNKVYQSSLDNIEQKDNKIEHYKVMTDELKMQISEMNHKLVDMESENQERERQWNIQQRELYNCIRIEREKNG